MRMCTPVAAAWIIRCVVQVLGPKYYRKTEICDWRSVYFVSYKQIYFSDTCLSLPYFPREG